jgi:hypothetical protein
MELSLLVNREIVRPIRHGVYAMAGVPSGALGGWCRTAVSG